MLARVSNDNPQAEAHFKTMKYQPDYPGRFATHEHARAWLADFFGKKYQAICWTMAPFLSPSQLPYRFFYSKGDLNTGGYASPAFDKLADEANSATGAAQKADWQNADKILTEELPWVWTTSGPIGFVMSPKLEGVEWEQPYRQRYR